MVKCLYYCVERGDSEPVEYWGWFESDTDAVQSFKKRAKSWKNNEWYVGKVREFDGVEMSIKTDEVKIFTT